MLCTKMSSNDVFFQKAQHKMEFKIIASEQIILRV